MMTAMRQLGRPLGKSSQVGMRKMSTYKTTGFIEEELAQRGRPAVPDHWTGRPGGSGAQPPLHLIYMVKVAKRRNV